MCQVICAVLLFPLRLLQINSKYSFLFIVRFFRSFCQQKKTENNETIVKKAAAVDNVASDAAKDAGATVESLIKHPLQNSWTLWYYDNEKDKSWELCQVI